MFINMYVIIKTLSPYDALRTKMRLWNLNPQLNAIEMTLSVDL